jgi:hypothetical protein
MKKFLGICTLSILVLAIPATAADLALKMQGTEVPGTGMGSNPGALDQDIAAVVNHVIGEVSAHTINDFDCYQMPFFDLKTTHEVGVGVDCLRPNGVTIVNDSVDNPALFAAFGLTAQNELSAAPDQGSPAVFLEAYTFFFLPGGLLVNNGLTSVMPFFPGVGSGSTGDFAASHMTGSLPESQSGIVYADGKFAHWEGTGQVRLSGAVDLSILLTDGKISFSCLFVAERPDEPLAD